MFYKFINIKFSFKKFKFFVYNIFNFSKFIFELLIYLNYFFNKSCIIFKNMLLYVLNDLKFKYTNVYNFKIVNFILGKGKSKKRLNYRCKGNLDIIKKRYFNVFLFLN